MSDQHFMRVWNSGRRRFSTDFHHRFSRVRRRLSPGPLSVKSIGSTYESAAQGALLRGFAASVVTTTLFLGGIFALTSPPVDTGAMVHAVIEDLAPPTRLVELA